MPYNDHDIACSSIFRLYCVDLNGEAGERTVIIPFSLRVVASSFLPEDQ